MSVFDIIVRVAYLVFLVLIVVVALLALVSTENEPARQVHASVVLVGLVLALVLILQGLGG